MVGCACYTADPETLLANVFWRIESGSIGTSSPKAAPEDVQGMASQKRQRVDLGTPGENCVVDFTVMRGGNSHFTMRRGESEW